jgi:Xaa-Pro aminopeptidase
MVKRASLYSQLLELTSELNDLTAAGAVTRLHSKLRSLSIRKLRSILRQVWQDEEIENTEVCCYLSGVVACVISEKRREGGTV